MQESAPDFQAYYEDFCSRHNIDIAQLNDQHKKIALSLHPDRVDKNLPPETRKDMVSRFRKANRAMEQRKYFILLDIADELNITTPRNYAQQNRWMKREIDRIEPLVRAQKNTYNYKFADTETDDERDVLIKQFLYQLFGFQLPENS